MAGTITHSWNGTVLTITSDSGTSSCDLVGATGPEGIRGPQGPAGIAVSDILIYLDNYYTKAEVDAMFVDGSEVRY